MKRSIGIFSVIMVLVAPMGHANAQRDFVSRPASGGAKPASVRVVKGSGTLSRREFLVRTAQAGVGAVALLGLAACHVPVDPYHSNFLKFGNVQLYGHGSTKAFLDAYSAQADEQLYLAPRLFSLSAFGTPDFIPGLHVGADNEWPITVIDSQYSSSPREFQLELMHGAAPLPIRVESSGQVGETSVYRAEFLGEDAVEFSWSKDTDPRLNMVLGFQLAHGTRDVTWSPIVDVIGLTRSEDGSQLQLEDGSQQQAFTGGTQRGQPALRSLTIAIDQTYPAVQQRYEELLETESNPAE